MAKKIKKESESNLSEEVVETASQGDVIAESEQAPAVVKTLSECKDIADREKFVQNYNANLNAREQRLIEAEKALAERETAIKNDLPELDKKQALIASLVAKNEAGMEEVEKGRQEIKKQLELVAIQKKINEDKENALVDREKAAVAREKALSDKESEVAEIRANVSKIQAELNKKSEELKKKQDDFDLMNRNFNLQAREFEIYKKRVEKLVSVNKLEKEFQDAK